MAITITKEDLLELDVHDGHHWYKVKEITPEDKVIFIRDEKEYTGTYLSSTLTNVNSGTWKTRKSGPFIYTYSLWI